MGIFEFIVVLVLITTIGEVVKARAGRPVQLPPERPDDGALESTVDELNRRLLRLEEERDFYRALLEPGDRADATDPPDPA